MWYNTVIEWAELYALNYPFFKIYKDRVGANVRAQSASATPDAGTCINELRKQLALLPQGHYIIQLKKKLEAAAGNMETEFDVPYGSSIAIGSLNNSNTPQAQPGEYMTVHQYQENLNVAIGNLKKEWETDRKIEKLEEENRKLQKKIDNPERKGFDLETIKGMLPEIMGLFHALKGTPNQVASIGYTDGNNVPTGPVHRRPSQRNQPPAAQQKTTVQDLTPDAAPVVHEETDQDPGELDEIDERIYQAEMAMLKELAKDRPVDKARADLAFMMEAVAGSMQANLNQFNLFLPHVLENHKHYTHE